jgi:uncharacterized Zn finger protein
MVIENYIEILSKSSTGIPYTVKFYLKEKGISANCSCPAGENRRLCKHIIQIINAEDSILFDNNQKNLLEKINSHLQNTDIPRLISSLREKEILLEKTQENVKKAKKSLEKAILGK